MTAPTTTPPAPTDTNTPATGTPPVPTPTAGDDPTPAATDPTGTEAVTPPADDPATWDPERAKRTIENQRRVEAEQKRVIAEQKAKLDTIEREKLTEAERVAADLATATAARDAARKEVADARFEAAAVAAGIPADRLTAARAVAGEVVTTDASGNVSVDTTVFDRLKAEHAYLFGSQAAPQPNVSFGAAASQGPGGQQGALSPDEVAMAQRAGMTNDEWAKYAQRTKR